MGELVIVIADVYLGLGAGSDAPAPEPARGMLPGIEALRRFGRGRSLEGSWREWAARWLGLERYAALPPASVAAAALEAPPGPVVWLAEPLHLTEGVGRFHLQRRGRLRLEPDECARLAADFTSVFDGSGLALVALPSGAFLLGAPAGEPVRTSEPARLPAGTVAEALPSGAGAAPLRRLGCELEMWLHGHPLNEARRVRGQPPVSTLWIWGGGGAPAEPVPGAPGATEVFGMEAYVAGLARLGGRECRAVAPRWPYAPRVAIARALHTLEVSVELQRRPEVGLLEGLMELDRAWVEPAVRALADGSLRRLWLLANDRVWSMRARDRWRRWRRARLGLEALT